jgi:hypothetical protein
MTSLSLARDQLDAAADLPDLLRAAYACFVSMISEIESQHDPGNPLFVPFLMAGATAASCRFALAAAPSLPAPARTTDPAPSVNEPAATPGEAALALGELAELLSRKLRAVALTATDGADRQACADAARHAADLSARFGRTPRS